MTRRSDDDAGARDLRQYHEMHAWDEMRYMHMKHIAHALMLTPRLFEDHNTFLFLLHVTRS